MKVIFFGSDDFGIPSLEILKEKFELVAIVTAPDKPKGRGLKISATPVKEWGIKNKIDVFQPNLLDEKFGEILISIFPDLIVLISYGKILPNEIIKIPKIASLNLHPSLLPKYRGPAPIEWTLIKGEKETGITVIKMDEKIDTGKIVVQEKIPVLSSDNAFTLKEKLSKIAPEILLKGIERLKNGEKTYSQKGTVSYARKLTKKDGEIKWEKKAEEIYNLIRGVIIWPTAYTYLKIDDTKKIIKIFSAEIGIENGKFGSPGEIIKIGNDFLEVACGDGTLKIKEIQVEGKKKMNINQFLCGWRWPLKKFHSE